MIFPSAETQKKNQNTSGYDSSKTNKKIEIYTNKTKN